MKNLILILILGIIVSCCKSTKYIEVPVDRVKIEYRNSVSIDTIYRNDSTIIRENGDTVFLEKYKYIYKVKELKDTVNITDTITVVNTVEVTKEVNKLYNWQIVLMTLGAFAIVILLYGIIKWIKK